MTELCFWCGIRPATEMHHCIIHRRKGVPELDHPYNLMAVCRQCHSSGEVNSHEARLKWWEHISRKYGGVNVMSWYMALPLKVKERYELC